MFNFVIAAAAQNDAGGLLSLLLMVVLFVVMYFVLIRPQKKQEKEANAMRDGLRVGDEITTIGGIIGKIVSIKDPTCIIETGRDGTRIRILKSAVKCVDVPATVTIAPVETEEKEEKTEVTESTESTESKKSKKKNKK